MSDDNKKKSTSRPRMMGLDDLKRAEGEDKSMYAGGEKSGMALEGADRPEHDLVRRIFEQAQQQLNNWSFGLMIDLGSQLMRKSRQITRTLTFWRNGFTVTDAGPLYQYDDAASQNLLQMLQSGHAPLDLLQVEPGQPVDVRVAHRMTVDWSPPPKSTLQSFTGRGHRLGDLAEPSSSSSSSSSPPSGQAKTTTSSTPQKSIVPEPNIDKSQPTTTLQLRLADGSRINATFNSGNTVVQLHAYITSVSPSNRPFSLLAGRPPLKLAHDDGRSLTEANLLNTVIIQQWQ